MTTAAASCVTKILTKVVTQKLETQAENVQSLNISITSLYWTNEKKVRKETTTTKITECIKQAAIFRSEDPAAAAQHPERGGGVGKQQRKVGSRVLPYNRRVALSDSDVVGGPLHIHTPDGESCGDKTKQSEKRSL